MTIAFAIPQTISFLLPTISELCKWLLHCTAQPASMQNALTDYRHKGPKAKPFSKADAASCETVVARASRPCFDCTFRTGGTPAPLPKHHRRGPKGVQVYLDDFGDVLRVTSGQHPSGWKGMSPSELEDNPVTLQQIMMCQCQR